MLSDDDDRDSLFGDAASDSEQMGRVSASLALPRPSPPSKSCNAAASTAVLGNTERVGTSALSVSPLPESERTISSSLTNAAITNCQSFDITSGSSGEASTPKPLRPHNMPMDERPHLAAASERPRNYLRSHMVPPPNSTSTRPARPKKRPRQSSSSPPTSDFTTSFGALMQVLREDIKIVALLQTLLSHLREGESPAAKRIRLDNTSGRVISHEEWKVSRTQELVAELSLALKNGLQKASANMPNVDGRDLQNIIQQWIYSKLMAATASTPPSTSAPSTPNSLFHSALPLPTLPGDSTLSVPGPSKNSTDPLQALLQELDYVPPASSSSSEGDLLGLGVFLPTDGLPQPTPTGPLDFSELESLLGLAPTVPTAPVAQSSPANDFIPIDPLLTTLQPTYPNSLPAWSYPDGYMALDPSVIPAGSAVPIHNAGQTLGATGLPISGLEGSHLDPIDRAHGASTTSRHHPFSSTPSLVSPMIDEHLSLDAMDIEPPMAPFTTTHIPPDHTHLRPSVPTNATILPPRVSPAPLSNNPQSPPVALSEIIRPQGNPTDGDSPLQRAKAHRQTIQKALHEALASLWDLEIEHATLSKIVRNVTEKEALTKITVKPSRRRAS